MVLNYFHVPLNDSVLCLALCERHAENDENVNLLVLLWYSESSVSVKKYVWKGIKEDQLVSV